MHVFTMLFFLAVVEGISALPISKRDYEEFLNEMAKRDLEEAMFLTPPESLAFVMELPRTDRKNFAEQEALLDSIDQEESQMAHEELPKEENRPKGASKDVKKEGNM
ncbi:hypothetical protein L596_027859 [Steinernema carpocapsae]|uniref:Uncharacterized protein n=1 Tax=Steinernema carpocapsae TaxID=34508 RepID=A0A4U5LWR0_STECR|nr:hypothetical protein L596_027859 [Steinernema carpocapsae]